MKKFARAEVPPVDRRQHLFARCIVGEGPEPRFDIGAFAERLLTFERYTIQSRRCREVRDIVNLLGVEQTLKLFEGGVLALHDRTEAVGSLAGGALTGRQLPPFGYRLKLISTADPVSPAQTARQNVFSLEFPGKTHRASQRLKSFLAERVHTNTSLEGVLEVTSRDLTQRSDLLRAAIAEEARRQDLPDLGDFLVSARPSILDPNAIQLTTDIPQRLDRPAQELHAMVERAVCAVAAVNQELAFMSSHEAVTCLPSDDLDFFAMKVDSTARDHAGSVSQHLSRVLDVAELPDLRSSAAAGNVDFRKLIDARDSDEAREFRRWLRTVDMIGDDELDRILGGLRRRLAPTMNAWQTKVATILAFGAVTLPLSTIPAYVAGAAISALDTFVLQKVLSAPGPALFVHSQVRSLFDRA